MDPISATSATSPLSVEIDAPKAAKPSAAALFAARSSKCSPGDMTDTGRSDGAAPPTAATCPGTFTFGDLVDTINPLQHIPVLSSLYRSATGNSISTASNIAGGALFGGPVGGMFALASSLFAELQIASDSDDTAAAQAADARKAAMGAASPATLAAV